MKTKIILVFICSFCICNSHAQSQTLEYFLKEAQQNSPLIHQLKNSNKIVDFDLKQFNAIYRSPKISVNSTVLFAPIIDRQSGSNKFKLVSSGSNDYIGYDLGASNGGQFQALISVTQPLFNGSNYEVQKKKARLLKETNNTKVQLTKASLKQLVTHQYILCILAQKQLENNQKTFRIIKEQLTQMKPLVERGVYKLTDLKLLEIALKNNQVESERLAGEFLSNFNALYLICGIQKKTSNASLEDIDLTVQTSVKNSSLFTQQFDLDSLSVAASQQLVHLNYVPQVALYGDAGLNATYLPKPNRLGFSVGISLKWNLFDGHQKETSYQQSRLQLENIAIDKSYFKNQNSIRKKNILSQLANLENQLNLIDNQLAEYHELLELYQVEIKHGLISVLELKTLITEINSKEQAKTDALMTREILINSYNYWNQ